MTEAKRSAGDPGSTIVNVEQAHFWTEVAPGWLAMEDRLEALADGPGRLAMDRLALQAGQRVIDVGCGSGKTTAELSSRVGARGHVVGVDLSERLLAAAAERVRRSGSENVELLRADVQVHDLGESTFDAAYSRFGVMFFGDPEGAFANVRRAMKPGGRLAFVCWQSVFDNEWMLVPGQAVMSITGAMAIPEPGAPGPFSLSDPDRVYSILQSAGFDAIEVERHNDIVASPAERIPELAEVSTRMGPFRRALDEAGEKFRNEVLVAVEGALREQVHEGELRLSRGVLMTTAMA